MNLQQYQQYQQLLSRRAFLGNSLTGIGAVAATSLLVQDGFALQPTRQGSGGIIKKLHHPQKAKRVIHLCMAGGPSHLDLYDHKPKLIELNGKPMPESFTKGQQLAQLQGKKLSCMGAQHPFRKFGESGQQIGEVLPHIGSIADDICIVRSMQTEQINHDPAHTFMNTGSIITGRPSMGSWLLYGIGSEGDDLPGYVVLTSAGGGQGQPISSRQWHSGFLPSKFQGVQFQSKGDAVNYVNNPPGISRESQKEVVDTIGELNRMLGKRRDDAEIETRISQYEMAFRMQMSVPGLMDVKDETQETLDLYGCKPGDGSFASNCLLARRLAQRGVRFIQLYHRGWDHHGGIKKGIKQTAGYVDQASAALLKDLKRLGMLEDTLIIWGGEFGRTPMAQGSGRDHHIKAFSVWMAGAGIKGGISYGSTDELGYAAVENIVPVHDLHATMLHQCGINHRRLTFRFQGRDFRLTDVHGHVLKDILA